MWYWYISGAVTVLFVQSLILNVGLVRGWVRFKEDSTESHSSKSVTYLYDQDNSGSYRRPA